MNKSLRTPDLWQNTKLFAFWNAVQYLETNFLFWITGSPRVMITIEARISNTKQCSCEVKHHMITSFSNGNSNPNCLYNSRTMLVVEQGPHMIVTSNFLPSSQLTACGKLAREVGNCDHMTATLWNVITGSWAPTAQLATTSLWGHMLKPRIGCKYHLFSAVVTFNSCWMNGHNLRMSCMFLDTLATGKTFLWASWNIQIVTVILGGPSRASLQQLTTISWLPLPV